MTSTASQQNPAPNPSAQVSYASAAGANKKPATTTPAIAAGSQPPVVVGSSQPTQNARSTASPVNGRPPIMPALPAVAPAPAPAVVHGSTNTNGSVVDHSRQSSVTISASGPNSYVANGASGSGPKGNMPRFGFSGDSPANSHSTPQQTTSAPIPIPGNAPIPSPAHSPSPIPQPSASGGRPPSIPQDGPAMKFGSLGGEGERHMKHASMSQNTFMPGAQPHVRRESTHSMHGDMNHGGQGAPRGGFQGGRGRGGYGPNHPNQSFPHGPNMGYPPNAPFPRGPAGQGRGAMASQFTPRAGFPSSPQPNRSSPAMQPVNPTTPHMQHTMPIPAGGYQYNPPGVPYIQNYPYAQFQPGQNMMGYGGYGNQVNYMNSAAQPASGGYPQAYASGQYPQPPTAPQMSRNSSQVSERPSSSTGQSQLPINSASQPQNKGSPAPSTSFVRAKKSAAIVIKSATTGEVFDPTSLKTPSSPAPPVQPAKTPPVVASTPTPPPKPATPSHARTESASTKSTEQLRLEFKEKVRKQAGGDAAAQEEDNDKPVTQGQAEEDEPKQPEAEEATPAEKSEIKDEEKADAEPAPAEETEDERMDREIREMEEAEAKREKEEAEYNAKKAAKAEEAKKLEDTNRAATAADNDRKLREQEREMERLEEERERQRKENEDKVAAGSKAISVADALREKISGITAADKKEPTPSTADAVADKLADLKITTEGAAAAKPAGAEKRAKPAALNLKPINTSTVEPPQPSAALQSLKTARFLDHKEYLNMAYPAGFRSPNPALNSAVTKKGKTFKYDAGFLLQFQKVFTEQPSLDFSQQVKTLLGDGERSASGRTGTPAGGSGRQNSRSGAAGFPGGNIGNFHAPAKPVGPGSTSAERFARANAAMQHGSTTGGGGMAFGRGFPNGSAMSRTPSSSTMGNIPNSPRTRSTRGGSKRDNFTNTKSEAQAAKTMPLTAGMEIKPIAVSSTGWKPISLVSKSVASPTPNGLMDPAMVQRKVKAALNKMTPEKFDKISDQILEIAMQSKDEEDGRTLRQVIQLTFEKATDEAHWASMYAKFCKRMLETMSPDIRDTTIKDKNGNVVNGGALFRKYLLNRCQEEFERGWKTDLPAPKEGGDSKTEEAAMLSDEYYLAAAAKRRGLGLVQFIGELYKLGMLTERIMHECVRKLVDYQGTPDEAEIESLSKLLRTIGASLDATDKGKPMMDAYFQRIQNIVDLPALPSRLKYMLMDVLDLRRRRWVSNELNKGPKTLDEVRAEAEAAAALKAAENNRSNTRGGPGGRAQGGRGDARNFSYNQPAPNQVGMDDLRRLKGSASRTASSNMTLGPTSMFSSRSNSGRRLGGPGGAFGRAGEESGASSRTGTPPTRDSQPASRANAFDVLANMDTENPASPPSTAASPALAKAVPDTAGATDKKESD